MINEKLFTDVEVLQHEMECVRRKSATNCTDCFNCDLLMTDQRILSAYDNAIKALQDNVQVVHGRWEDTTCITLDYRCSVCRKITLFSRCNPPSNYCPNCGAKMDLEEANGSTDL